MSIVLMEFTELQDSKGNNITITEDSIIGENFSILKSICSSDALKYGGCESNCVEFTVIKDDTTILIEGNSKFKLTYNDNPEGFYCVFNKTLSDDRKNYKIVAYDLSYDLYNTSITDWWNANMLNRSKNLLQFRNSLFGYMGISDASNVLPLDSKITIVGGTEAITSDIFFRDACRAIAEINGRFAIYENLTTSTRTINFKQIEDDSSKYIYPSSDLYPASDLYPYAPQVITADDYYTINYNDFSTQKITGVKVLYGDGGWQQGSPINNYIIEKNIITSNVAEPIADLPNIGLYFLRNTESLIYQPIKALRIKHNDNVKLGNGIMVITPEGEYVKSIVLSKKTTGIYAQKDEIISNGVFHY